MKRKRIFGICMLTMMTVLACIVLFAITAKAWTPDGSYSLIIKKEFDLKNIPDNVAEEVKKKTYTFKIEGKRKVPGDSGWQDVEVNETITLPRKDDNGQLVWESKVYKSAGPFDVTVTELTDNIDIQVDGKNYNMSASSTDSSLQVNSRKHEVQLRNNAALTIKRTDNSSETIWYHITNRPYDEHAESSSNFKDCNEVFSIGANGSKELTGLCAAIYTIEQIAVPDGYQLQMGKREETVVAGNKGHFHINGTPGKLTLTAGGSSGDGATHYYVIDRTEKEQGDNSEFVVRTVGIDSGASYVLDNLPKGGYTVTEYSSTENANTKFSVTMTQTSEKGKSGYSSAPQYTNFRTFALTEGTTYIKLNSFGPLYDASKKNIINAGIIYELDYGVGNENGGITYRPVSGTLKDSFIYTFNSPPKLNPHPNALKIGFRVRNLSNTTAKYLSVSWTEYTEKETTKTFDRAGVQYSSGIEVDERGQMTITAPDPQGEYADKIAYYYTVRDKNGNLISGPEGTATKEGTTVALDAGEKVTLEGLTAGSYKITETIDWVYAGFTMVIEGHPFGTTEAGKTMEVEVGGKRDITISKPALTNYPDGAVDDRGYSFSIIGDNNFNETISLKAGESNTITLPRDGKYSVIPQNDSLETYELSYKDSGAIYGTAKNSSATITFTNAFGTGEYGYRYVHEYYIKEADDSYTYVGNSQITTRLGRPGGEIYEAKDISQIPDFQGNRYKHFEEAYGWVDGILPKTENQILTISGSEEGEDILINEEESSESVKPTESAEPVEPTESEKPTEPIEPTESIKPGKPTEELPEATELPKPTESAESTEEPEESVEPAELPETMQSAKPTELPQSVESIESLRSIGSVKLMKRSEAKQPTKLTNVVKLVESITTEKSMEFVKTAEFTEPVGSAKPTEIPELTEPIESAKPTEYPDFTEPVESAKPTEYPESTEPVESAKPTEFPEPAEPVESAEPTEPMESAKPIGSASPTELPESSIDSEKRMKTRKAFSTTSCDNQGIITAGAGFNSDGTFLNYAPDSDMSKIDVTEDASQIIILRYYRDRQMEGSYNVIHVYYRRDAEGDHWEGTSGILPQKGELGVKYTGDAVDKVTSFQPQDANEAYNYTYDGRPQYGIVEETGDIGGYDPNGENEYAGNGMVYRPNNEWTAAEGTEEGNQIIILRYYREPAREGSYRVVHEYYYREKDENQVGAENGDTGNSDSGTENDGDEDDPSDGDSLQFNGTLERKDGYVYTFEGRTEIGRIDARLGFTHVADEIEKQLEYCDNQYVYFDAGYGNTTEDYSSYKCNSNMQWVVSTENGEEIIILRYIRGDTSEDPPDVPKKPDTPEEPDVPEESDTPEEPDTPEESDTPEEPEPSEKPKASEKPKNPEYPTELPDPNDPDSPDRITILVDGEPTTYVKIWDFQNEEWVYILESEVPLMGIPDTGDSSRIGFWVILTVGSLLGLLTMFFFHRKRTINRE